MKTAFFPLVLIVAITLHLVSHFALSDQYIFKQVIVSDQSFKTGQIGFEPALPIESPIELVGDEKNNKTVAEKTLQDKDASERDDLKSIVSFVSNE
jgi:hypothetical protein